MQVGFCHPTECLMAKERARNLLARSQLATPSTLQRTIGSGGGRCSVEGCRADAETDGRCHTHYLRRLQFASR